jgi:hypothetical protein
VGLLVQTHVFINMETDTWFYVLQWLQTYAKKIADLGAFEGHIPNHVLVNEYEAGQGIMVIFFFFLRDEGWSIRNISFIEYSTKVVVKVLFDQLRFFFL